jgi:hypothetical protein
MKDVFHFIPNCFQNIENKISRKVAGDAKFFSFVCFVFFLVVFVVLFLPQRTQRSSQRTQRIFLGILESWRAILFFSRKVAGDAKIYVFTLWYFYMKLLIPIAA